MATVTKTVLKTYFEQGDIPTQGQYADLIDSQFGLGETDTQIIQGTISASVAEIEYVAIRKLYLPGIGISAETSRTGSKVGTTFIVGKTLEVVGDINTTGNISGSSLNISGHITASGNIDGDIYYSNGSKVIRNTGGVTNFGTSGVPIYFPSNITASGHISASGTSNLTMGGDGQLNALTLKGKETGVVVYNWEANAIINSKCFSITTTSPEISTDQKISEDQIITNDEVKVSSVIVASCSANVQVVCHTIRDGVFQFHLVNNTTSDINSVTGTIINFVVL